jgi:hypothetical protein
VESPPLPTEKKSALLTAVKRGVRTAFVTTGISLVVLIAGLMIFEEKLIYFPTVGGVGPSPGQEVELTAADGVKLHAWYFPHPQAI